MQVQGEREGERERVKVDDSNERGDKWCVYFALQK